MSKRIEAVFQNGVFRPDSPVKMDEGERVLISVEPHGACDDDLGDVRDLLDHEFVEACLKRCEEAPALEQVQAVLSVFAGSLADRVCEERNER